MENSLKDNPNIPKRFARLIEKRSSPELDSLEGVFCDVAVFRGNAAPILNPTSEQVVDYSQTVTLSTNSQGLGNYIKCLLSLTESRPYPREPKLFRRLGKRAVHMISLMSGSDLRLRGEIKETVARANSSAKFNYVRGDFLAENLLAPDTYVYDTENMDTGKSAGIYLLGDTAIDQQKRANHFWRKIDKLAKKHELPHLQNHQRTGITSLTLAILSHADSNQWLDDMDKHSIASSVLSVMIESRGKVIYSMNELQQLYERQRGETLQRSTRERFGIKLSSDRQLKSDTTPKDVIKEVVRIDQVLLNDIDDLFGFIKHKYNCAEERRIIADLKKIVHTDKQEYSMQNTFLRELSRSLRQAGKDPIYASAELSQPLDFIDRLPSMVPVLDDISESDYRKIYAAFRKLCKSSGLELRVLEDESNSVKQVIAEWTDQPREGIRKVREQ